MKKLFNDIHKELFFGNFVFRPYLIPFTHDFLGNNGETLNNPPLL